MTIALDQPSRDVGLNVGPTGDGAPGVVGTVPDLFQTVRCMAAPISLTRNTIPDKTPGSVSRGTIWPHLSAAGGEPFGRKGLPSATVWPSCSTTASNGCASTKPPCRLAWSLCPCSRPTLPASTAYILANSGTRLLLIDSYDRWLCLAAHCTTLTDLKRVLCLRGREALGEENGRVRDAGGWLATAPDAGAEPEAHITPDTLATSCTPRGRRDAPKASCCPTRTCYRPRKPS